MTTNQQDLFRGTLLRFAPVQEQDRAIMGKWTESYEYLSRMDTDFAVPESVPAFERDRETGKGGNSVNFRLRTLADDALVGFVALFNIEWNNQSAKLAIGIGDPDHRNKGYGTDALKMILRYAFHELNLNRVWLDVIEYNAAAIRAYEKVGFQREGRLRSDVLRFGRSYDRILMGMLRSEWEAMQEQPSLL